MGPACVPLAPPTAIVNGAAFSSDISCRRLKSFSLPVVNCVAPLVVGGLFSTLTLTLSRHSSFKSGFIDVWLASFDDVDEDEDAGLPSEIVSMRAQACIDENKLTI